jgi:hypothetical protein
MLKSFFLGAARIATAIVLVVVALAAIGWGLYEFSQARERSKNAPLAELKKWPAVKIEALGGVEMSLSTMWRDGRLFYQFSVDGYTEELALVTATNRKAAWTLTFFDGNGFRLFEHQVPLGEMARLIDASGRSTRLSASEDTFAEADNYRGAASWSVTWNFEVPQRAEPASRPAARMGGSGDRDSGPKWRNVALWRGLRKGMSKEQVRQILGEPGKITELSTLTLWYYGYPSGGEVTFGASGDVSSWSEP